ncbi:MAG: hypothetical protein LBK58_09445 [Prevotellaceae bacterium]|jgi:hypothetical protein|nr:hypothetical protein [Prevotellaceae bacterium]
MSENSQTQNGSPVFIVQDKKSNGVGTAGFVLALIGLIFCFDSLSELKILPIRSVDSKDSTLHWRINKVDCNNYLFKYI